MHDQNIQQAIQDLATIRRAIENSGNENAGANSGIVRKAQFIVQGIALGASVFLLGYELLAAQNMTWMLELSRLDREIAEMGLMEVALSLPFLLAAIYFVAWRSAKHTRRSLPEFLQRNFTYLRKLNFLSDLFVKFVVLSLAVLSGHGEWVPALLLLFTGDYLLQGRFFTLPLPVALLAGPLCFAGAGTMYLYSSTQLWIPLAVFVALNVMSLSVVCFRRA